MKQRNPVIAAAIGVSFAFGLAYGAEAPAVIADNESIFVDGKTFEVTPGRATGDAGTQIRRLGAREMGPGALIFRSREKLYVVDSPLRVQGSESANHDGIYVGADEARPNRILIEYVPPNSSHHQKLLDRLKARHALEMLQQMFSPFRLPVDLTIKTLECGSENAWFARNGDERTINLCYEYLQAIMASVPEGATLGDITPHDALVGQFFYVVAHELGHALFDIYDVTLFGREEDAADHFAAFVMLQFDLDRARRLIGGAAYSFRMYMTSLEDKPTVTVPLAAFSSTHGLPDQRFYNLLCMAYGANVEAFAFLVDNRYLPKSRADNCPREFYLLSRAFRREIGPHVDRELAAKVTRGLTLLGQP
jgi:hypothetical protein